MAKRIEFIAPVESMRGNLSGSQDLVYAANDNKAFESPAGQTNYAKNYRTSYVGARRASDGRKYFGVKTKTATKTSPAALRAMALMGATGTLYALFKEASVRGDDKRWGQVVYNYENAFKKNYKSLREYVSAVIRQALIAKSATIVFGGPTVATYQNPWISTERDAIYDMPFFSEYRFLQLMDLVSKFMLELGPEGAFKYYIVLPSLHKALFFGIAGKTVAETYAKGTVPEMFVTAKDELGNELLVLVNGENMQITGFHGGLAKLTVYNGEDPVAVTETIDPTITYTAKQNA